MRITQKGQVTIPQEIRDRFGFLPYTEVEFVAQGENVVLRKASTNRRGAALMRRLRGSAGAGMSTDEIMRLTRGDD